jgi:hypothetical protein
MGIEQLTPAIMRKIRVLAWACEAREDNDNWCGDATERVGEYLNSIGIDAIEYHSAPGWFGGASLDWSHAYLVLRDDGTIVDPTITQYLEHGSPWQKSLASGFPARHGVKGVAVVPVGHPFSKRMGYEAHHFALGLTKRPKWVKFNKRAEKARREMDAGGSQSSETSDDLLGFTYPPNIGTVRVRENPSCVDGWWAPRSNR